MLSRVRAKGEGEGEGEVAGKGRMNVGGENRGGQNEASGGGGLGVEGRAGWLFVCLSVRRGRARREAPGQPSQEKEGYRVNQSMNEASGQRRTSEGGTDAGLRRALKKPKGDGGGGRRAREEEGGG